MTTNKSTTHHNHCIIMTARNEQRACSLVDWGWDAHEADRAATTRGLHVRIAQPSKFQPHLAGLATVSTNHAKTSPEDNPERFHVHDVHCSFHAATGHSSSVPRDQSALDWSDADGHIDARLTAFMCPGNLRRTNACQSGCSRPTWTKQGCLRYCFGAGRQAIGMEQNLASSRLGIVSEVRNRNANERDANEPNLWRPQCGSPRNRPQTMNSAIHGNINFDCRSHDGSPKSGRQQQRPREITTARHHVDNRIGQVREERSEAANCRLSQAARVLQQTTKPASPMALPTYQQVPQARHQQTAALATITTSRPLYQQSPVPQPPHEIASRAGFTRGCPEASRIPELDHDVRIDYCYRDWPLALAGRRSTSPIRASAPTGLESLNICESYRSHDRYQEAIATSPGCRWVSNDGAVNISGANNDVRLQEVDAISNFCLVNSPTTGLVLERRGSIPLPARLDLYQAAPYENRLTDSDIENRQQDCLRQRQADYGWLGASCDGGVAGDAAQIRTPALAGYLADSRAHLETVQNVYPGTFVQYEPARSHSRPAHTPLVEANGPAPSAGERDRHHARPTHDADSPAAFNRPNCACRECCHKQLQQHFGQSQINFRTSAADQQDSAYNLQPSSGQYHRWSPSIAHWRRHSSMSMPGDLQSPSPPPPEVATTLPTSNGFASGLSLPNDYWSRRPLCTTPVEFATSTTSEPWPHANLGSPELMSHPSYRGQAASSSHQLAPFPEMAQPYQRPTDQPHVPTQPLAWRPQLQSPAHVAWSLPSSPVVVGPHPGRSNHRQQPLPTHYQRFGFVQSAELQHQAQPQRPHWNRLSRPARGRQNNNNNNNNQRDELNSAWSLHAEAGRSRVASCRRQIDQNPTSRFRELNDFPQRQIEFSQPGAPPSSDQWPENDHEALEGNQVVGDDCEEDEEVEAEALALVPSQLKGRLPLSVAEQMSEQASEFVQHHPSAAAGDSASPEPPGARTPLPYQSRSAGSGAPGSIHQRRPPAAFNHHQQRHHQQHSAGKQRSRSLATPAGHLNADRRAKPNNHENNLQVRRTLRVKVRKSKPILGIAIEGGFNVSGQLIPRIVCVHEEGAAYQCGKLRRGDLILEVNGISTVNMTHNEIAKTIANAYYQDERPYIEFSIGESVHV